MQAAEVRPYWELLNRKKNQLVIKRFMDITVSAAGLVVMSAPMIAVALYIKLDSPGPVFFRQERITAYGRRFRIHKFRTMVSNAEGSGSAVTAAGDKRITRAGSFLRRTKIDELPQLIDVLAGNMSLVGTRPEAPCYVEHYKPVYMATLLLPAGITSEASLRFLEEEELLRGVSDIDGYYIDNILPVKMIYNLSELKMFSIANDIRTIIRTLQAAGGHSRTNLHFPSNTTYDAKNHLSYNKE